MKRYDSVQDILKEFFELRLHYYKLRKDWLVGSLGAFAAKLSNQARFVLEKIDGKVSIGEWSPTHRKPAARHRRLFLTTLCSALGPQRTSPSGN